MALPLEAAATYADDFKWRFLTCAALTVPIAYLAEPVQVLLGMGVDKRLERANEIVLALAAAVVLYGSWPFLAGTFREVWRARPGPMIVALLALGAATALAVASIVVGAEMRPVWEAVALVDALLLGFWLALAGAARTGAGLHEGTGAPFPSRAGDVLAVICLTAAVVTLALSIELGGFAPATALTRGIAVLATSAPLALAAVYRCAPTRAAVEIGTGERLPRTRSAGAAPAEFVVTHVLVPSGGSEEEVLALALSAEGDEAVLDASRRAAMNRGVAVDQPQARRPAEEVRLLYPDDVRAAGIDAPFEAVGELSGNGTEVVWLIERWRVSGALALETRPVPGPAIDTPAPRTNRLAQSAALVVGYHALALPVAAGVLVPYGVTLPAPAGAVLAGIVAACVAVNAGRWVKSDGVMSDEGLGIRA